MWSYHSWVMTPRVSCPSIPDSVTTANKGFYSSAWAVDKKSISTSNIVSVRNLKINSMLMLGVGEGAWTLISASEPSASSTLDCYMLNKPTRGWGLTLQPLRLAVIQHVASHSDLPLWTQRAVSAQWGCWRLSVPIGTSRRLSTPRLWWLSWEDFLNCLASSLALLGCDIQFILTIICMIAEPEKEPIED